MSYELVDWVLSKDVTLPATDRLVLAVYAKHANKDGGNARPAIGTVAAESGLSVDGVKKAIARLRRGGWLIPVEQRDPKRNRGIITYRIGCGDSEIRCGDSEIGCGDGEVVPDRHTNARAFVGTSGTGASSEGGTSGTGVVPHRHGGSASQALGVVPEVHTNKSYESVRESVKESDPPVVPPGGRGRRRRSSSGKVPPSAFAEPTNPDDEDVDFAALVAAKTDTSELNHHG